MAELVPARPTLPNGKGGVIKGDSDIIKAVRPLNLNLANKGVGPLVVRKVLRYVEPYWFQHKRYPSDLDMKSKFQLNDAELRFLHTSKLYIESLKELGIAPPNAQSDYLTEKQIAAIAIITNFNDHRPIAVRLEDIGVTTEQLQGWNVNPEFKRRLADRASDAFDNAGSYATTNLARLVERGNFNAIKFYYEITGQANSPEAINAKRLIQTLVEAVQKHVKDPAVLAAIAQEVQAIAGMSLGG